MNRLLSTIGVNLAIVGLYLVGSVTVAQSLGASGRGAFAALMAVFTLSLVVAEVGQSASVTYHVARDPSRVAATVAAGRRVMLVAALLLTTVVGTTAVATDVGASFGLSPVEMSWAVGACVVNALGAPYQFAAQAMTLRVWNGLRLMQPAAYGVAVLVGAGLGQLSVRYLVVALVGSVAVTLVVAWLVALRSGWTGGRPAADQEAAVRRYGLTSWAAALPLAVVQNGDRLVLSLLLAPSEVGRYAVALSVVGLSAPLATAVASLRFPEVAGLAREDVAARRTLVATTMRRSTVAVLAGTLGAALVGGTLVPVLFGADFADIGWLLWALAPVAAFRSLVLVATGLLRGTGRPEVPARAQLVTLVVAAVGLVPATLAGGLLGAALLLALAELLGLAVCSHGLARDGCRAVPPDPALPPAVPPVLPGAS